MLEEIVSVKKRILVIGSKWVNKQSEDFAYHSERLFNLNFFPRDQQLW